MAVDPNLMNQPQPQQSAQQSQQAGASSNVSASSSAQKMGIEGHAALTQASLLGGSLTGQGMVSISSGIPGAFSSKKPIAPKSR